MLCEVDCLVTALLQRNFVECIMIMIKSDDVYHKGFSNLGFSGRMKNHTKLFNTLI